MKAPEKIYLQVCGDCNANDCENCKFEDLEDNITWCKDKIFERDIEYTRTDAFIEKVSGWLKDCTTFTDMNGKKRIDKEMYKATFEDFRNYMKGEQTTKS